MGNAYVVGIDQNNYFTVKYNSVGTEVWSRVHDGTRQDYDEAIDVAVDKKGNVVVTGTSLPLESDHQSARVIATIKYDADGNKIWERDYWSTENDATETSATKLAIDQWDNVYVLGYTNGGVNNFILIRYDAAGALFWQIGGDSFHWLYGELSDMAVDNNGNIYVTGRVDTDNPPLGGWDDWITIKYRQSQNIRRFMVVDAESDKELFPLNDGDTINLAELPSTKINIRAVTDPELVGSVVFSLSGKQSRTVTENIAPYALAGNTADDYGGWTPPNGNYTLTVTPYTGAKATGISGMPATIHFHTVYQKIDSLVLVNANTDKDIRTLTQGDVIDLGAIDATYLNIRAVTHPSKVGSVRFNLNNKVTVVESYYPYAIGGDINGNFRPWALPVGRHVLQVTPFEGKNASGAPGKTYTLKFTVVDNRVVTAIAPKQSAPGLSGLTETKLAAYPNPFSGATTFHFSVAEPCFVTLLLFDTQGRQVARLYNAWANKGLAYQVPFAASDLPAGIYAVQLRAGNRVTAITVMNR